MDSDVLLRTKGWGQQFIEVHMKIMVSSNTAQEWKFCFLDSWATDSNSVNYKPLPFNNTPLMFAFSSTWLCLWLAFISGDIVLSTLRLAVCIIKVIVLQVSWCFHGVVVKCTMKYVHWV